MLAILDTYGFTAVKTGGYVSVIPRALVRAQPLPFVSNDQKRPDGEYVTTVLHIRSLPAGWLVPVLRPLLAQAAYLAAMPCANALIVVDRSADLRRLASVIQALDTGTPIKPPRCDARRHDPPSMPAPPAR